MSSFIKILTTLGLGTLVDKFNNKFPIVSTTKGILLKLGFIGILLMFSFMLIVLAGIVALVAVLFNNI